ncbi:hypothetical protein ACFP65_00805 [Marinilactibacillus sp. GCM10026970]|uniref:hypothetical protein n=1 Tax=Marinilactibacillus sp. GCM10026970 TaxID=3252642 RepID=UPI00360EF1FB
MNRYVTFTKHKFFEDKCNQQKQLVFLVIFLILLFLLRDRLDLFLITYTVIYPISYLLICVVQFKNQDSEVPIE